MVLNSYLGSPYFGPSYFGQASATAPVVVVASGGGNTRGRYRLPKKRPLSERDVLVADIIYAVAKRQIEQPRASERARVEQLSKALRAQDIVAEARHGEALAAERNRLISLEVAQLLRKFQAQEDEALLMILAETV